MLVYMHGNIWQPKWENTHNYSQDLKILMVLTKIAVKNKHTLILQSL